MDSTEETRATIEEWFKLKKQIRLLESRVKGMGGVGIGTPFVADQRPRTLLEHARRRLYQMIEPVKRSMAVRSLDSTPRGRNQKVTYEEFLLHPYGIVYLDEKYILSHFEFISGFGYHQLTVEASGIMYYYFPHLYDVNYSTFASTFITSSNSFISCPPYLHRYR